MPPKKAATIAREDTAASSDTLPRESRLKRGANHRDAPEESVTAVSAIPSFDIGSLSHAELQRYRKVMRLQVCNNHDPVDGLPKRFRRVEKEAELVEAARKHWNTVTTKENEVISSFFYSVKNQDKTFKLRFTDSGRN